jgi:hypothetical protein
VGLGDLTGVLSRYYLVGYWVPSFVATGSLALLLPTNSLPDEYVALGWSAKFLVLGFIALPLGLALLGLQYPVTRLFEGYVFERQVFARRGLRHLRSGLVWLQAKSYDRDQRIRDDEQEKMGARTAAARRLDWRFPSERARLLPTRFGNAYRASENYSFTRYGLDTVAIWPRVDGLLSEQERELHTNAASDLAFFMNGSLWAVIVGVVFAAEAAFEWWEYPIPFLAGYLLYRASIGAVERLGTERRSSIDLHRLELYERLGIRRPATLTEERSGQALAVNRFLLWGEPIPGWLLAKPSGQSHSS